MKRFKNNISSMETSLSQRDRICLLKPQNAMVSLISFAFLTYLYVTHLF
jgi:hypothetical protein